MKTATKFDNIQHALMIQTAGKLETKGNLLTPRGCVYKSATAKQNQGERLHVSPKIGD